MLVLARCGLSATPVVAKGVGRERAVGGIAATFDLGESTSEGFFPRIEGWCCPASAETP
ncbi:MAG: hypothetical protein WD827_01125 [Solirubrobacterales bacterium]